MIDAKLIHSLPRIPAPVLTLYLNTNPAEPRNQGHPPGYIIYLKSRGKIIGRRVPENERKMFQEELKRAENFLRNRRPSQRGMVLFSGPKRQEFLPMQVAVEDELHWGRPSLTQLLWLLDEHQPAGVVLVDRSGARFYRYWLGEMEEQAAEKFKLELGEWRKKHLMPPSHPGAYKTRGSQRDVFEQRVEAQYDRFFRDAAERIWQWSEREKVRPVFVAGPNETVERVWAELPRGFTEHAAVIKGDLARLKPAELEQRIAPEVAAWKREYELDEVTRMMNSRNGRRAVVGLDDTLRRLQEGAARALVVARGLGGKLRQCAKCGWTDRSADRECPSCGGERKLVALRAAMPELARKFSVPVEVVAGEAGRKLREAEGIGAWLR
jgi:hypothetical protein